MHLPTLRRIALILLLAAAPATLAEIDPADKDRAHGKNFLLNSDFSLWRPEERALPGWSLRGEEFIDRAPSDSGEGFDMLLRLPEGDDQPLRLSQRLYSGALRPDEMVWFSVEVDVGIGDVASMVLRTEMMDNAGGDGADYRVRHHGGGWRTLELVTEPAAGVNYFEMSIFVEATTRNPVRVRNPSAIIVPVVP